MKVKARTSDPSGFRPSRLYMFLVVSMAVLLATLAWRYPRGGESVVEANLTYSLFDNVTNEPVKDQERISRAVGQMHAVQNLRSLLSNLPAETLALNGLQGVQAAEELSKRVFVRVTPEPDHINHEVVVRFIGGSSSFALKLVEDLTAKFAAEHNNASKAEQAAAQLREVQERVKQMAANVSQLTAQLDDFVSSELSAAQLAHESHQHERVDSAEPVDAATADATPLKIDQPAAPAINMPIVEELNPNWVDLRNEIDDLEQEVNSLRVNFTSQHPDVQRLEGLAAELRQRFAQTPQFLRQGSDPSFVPPASDLVALESHSELPEAGDSIYGEDESESSGSAGGEFPSVEDATSEDLVQTMENGFVKPETTLTVEAAVPSVEFDEEAERTRILNSTIGARIVEQLETARADHQQALVAQASMQRRLPKLRESTLLRGQPSIVTRYTEELQASTMWSFIGLALAAGFGVALFRGRPKLPDTLYSKADAEKAMQTKSLGEISTNDGPELEFPSPGTIPLLARYATRSAEVVLLGSAVAVLLAVCSVPEFGSQFVENPFAAFAFAVDRISSFVT